MKRTQLCLCPITAMPYYLQEIILSCEEENVDLHMYCTLNIVVVDYRQIRIELGTVSADCHAKALTEQHMEDHFTARDVLLPEKPVILSIEIYR